MPLIKKNKGSNELFDSAQCTFLAQNRENVAVICSNNYKWRDGEPPREKLLRRGAKALSDAELLALFLRTGLPGLPVLQMAEQLLQKFGSLHHLLTADYATFCAQKGMGDAKFSQLQAIVELSLRAFSARLVREDAMVNSQATKEYVAAMLSHREREIFLVLFLDNQNRVIRCEEMFSGTINNVTVHPREIVREALKCNAAALILAHNHPSGMAEPSRADREMTDIIIRSCEIMDIRIVDHLVIGRGESVSFAERGWI